MPPTPLPVPHKSVTFCARCDPPPRTPRPNELRRGLSDLNIAQAKKKQSQTGSTDSDLKYYSEPDARNYFEIDYVFLKELRKIARNNCPKCRRKRSRRHGRDPPAGRRAPRGTSSSKENYVFCNGRYHSDKEHCQLCCRICSRAADPPGSGADSYSLVSRSYSQPPAPRKLTPKKARERKNSIQSNKSVSFLESSNDESIKDETNYTAKSFTNDLKRFLLKPSAPRQSLRDKFMSSFKQELEATKKSPKLKAIKGLWKSY